MSQRLTFRTIEAMYEEMRKENYLYTTSFETIARHFLDKLLDIEVFQSDFTEIKNSFKTEFPEEDLPEKEEEFYNKICSFYLRLKIEPSKKLFQYYQEASGHLKEIEETIAEFKAEINQIDKIKRNLTNKEAYRKYLLQYYIELNEEARGEITNFLSHGIRAHALREAQENLGFQSAILNQPYKYYNLSSLYQSGKVSELKNKFLDMPVLEHQELRYCYHHDKDEFVVKMQSYIKDYYIIERLERLIAGHHQLNKREEILKQLLEAYSQDKFLLFSNAVPLQIEGIFNDYCLELGIKPDELNTAALHKKLDIISDKDKNFTHYEYYKFAFPVLRNKVAHGNLYSGDSELTAGMLLLDLSHICRVITQTESIKINRALRYLKEYMQRPDKNNLLLAVLNLYKVEIPDFYELDEELADLKDKFLDEEIWAYLDQLIEQGNEVVNRGLARILIILKEDGIEAERCGSYLSKIGNDKSDQLDVERFERELKYMRFD